MIRVIEMNIFKRIFNYKIDNSNKTEPFLEGESGDVATGIETEKEKQRQKWRFPLSPLRTFLTLVSICIFAFSLSYYSAWLLGYQFTVYLLYFGFFFMVIMIVTDIKVLIEYFKFRKK